MLKKFTLVIAALAGAALVLVGCESPTGDAGAAGQAGAITFNTGAVTGADLEAAFALTGSVIIDSGVTSVAGEIPTGRTLYIAGGTKVTDGKSLDVQGTLDILEKAALDLSDKGTLIVAEGATPTAGGNFAITANAETSNITIEGTLALGENGSVKNKVTNNGTVTTSSGSGDTVKALLALAGTGKVDSSGTVNLGGNATLTLEQYLIISGGTLALGAAPDGVGVDVVNNGKINTATTSGAALQTIVNLGGAISSTGSVTIAESGTLAVPKGAELTVKGENALSVEAKAEVTVESGGVFFLDGTELENNKTNGTLGGTITIKPGAKTYSTGTFLGTGWTVIE